VPCLQDANVRRPGHAGRVGGEYEEPALACKTCGHAKDQDQTKLIAKARGSGAPLRHPGIAFCCFLEISRSPNADAFHQIKGRTG
jgi:hypothetical protein